MFNNFINILNNTQVRTQDVYEQYQIGESGCYAGEQVCYSEVPQQAVAMGHQEPHELQQRQMTGPGEQ